MIRYNIATLAKRAGKRRNATLPPIHERLATIHQYNVILNKMLAEIARFTKTVIVPTFQPVRMTRDTDESDFDALRIMAVRLAATATDAVNRILQLEAERHTATFRASAERVLGIDLSSVVTDEDLGEYMRSAAARNAGLIKSLGADTVKEIERIVLQNQVAGGTAKIVEKELIERFGVAKSRARLIAVDQTAKITAELNGIRQRQADIAKYEWQTSEDERVRPLHRSLNGNIYRWGQSTGAEGGQPPGMPIRCRCVALGIVEVETSKKAPAAPESSRRRELPATALTPLGNPAAIESEMRDFIMAQGLRTGVEHLWSYDRVTGIKSKKFGGTQSHVNWDDAFDKEMRDPRSQIISHHNHPSSNTFSDQDIKMLNHYRGLRGLHAHGHNGSTFYAEAGPALNGESIENIAVKLKSSRDLVNYEIIQKAINLPEGVQQPVGEFAQRAFHHFVMLMNEKRGFISKYTYDIKGMLADGLIEHKEFYDDLLVRIENFAEKEKKKP